jgi:hypothetical protein
MAARNLIRARIPEARPFRNGASGLPYNLWRLAVAREQERDDDDDDD